MSTLLGVFPTRVGMVRFVAASASSRIGFPHPRGDGPNFSCSFCVRSEFSPPAWGWSAMPTGKVFMRQVFPTRVGMVRIRVGINRTDGRFPHPRGDGPPESPSASRKSRFSPPAWGWSAGQSSSDQLPDVFPTRVGMVRGAAAGRRARQGFPHPRGDGPYTTNTLTGNVKFSPPAWGWSASSLL